MLTLRDFLVRGLLAGLIAGVAAFVVGYVVGEPPVAASIAIEEASGGHDHGTEPSGEATTVEENVGTEVPRDLQSTAGLATGLIVLGTALGGLAGIATGLAFGRFGRKSARATALAVSGTCFLVLYLVPFLIYPPNPPAVGHSDTIGYRTGLYFGMLLISLAAAALAVFLGRRLTPRFGAWYAGLIAVGAYLVIALIALGVMPRYDEVPGDFPASLLYEFRQASVITQAVVWGVIGVVLGESTHRLHQCRAGVAPSASLVSA